MKNHEQKKNARKQTTDRKTVEKLKRVDGRDHQINEVRQKAQDAHRRDRNKAVDDAHDRADSAYTFADFANNNANTRIKNQDNSVGRSHLAGGAVGYDEIGGGEVGKSKLDRTYSEPGHTHNYASSNHNHDDRYVRLSINFKRDLSLQGKKEIMDLLSQVEETANSPLAKLLTKLARLTTDDPGMGGEDLVDFLENGDKTAVEAWYEHHSYERMLRRALREGSEAARVRAHFDRDVRRLAYEEGVDIFDISDHYLDYHLSPAVGNIIRENWKAYCDGDQPPTWF